MLNPLTINNLNLGRFLLVTIGNPFEAFGIEVVQIVDTAVARDIDHINIGNCSAPPPPAGGGSNRQETERGEGVVRRIGMRLDLWHGVDINHQPQGRIG